MSRDCIVLFMQSIIHFLQKSLWFNLIEFNICSSIWKCPGMGIFNSYFHVSFEKNWSKITGSHIFEYSAWENLNNLFVVSIMIFPDCDLKTHKLIGNTPFISYHVCYWMIIQDPVEFVRTNEDFIAWVILFFGPSKSHLGIVPAVKLNTGILWIQRVNLERETCLFFTPK